MSCMLHRDETHLNTLCWSRCATACPPALPCPVSSPHLRLWVVHNEAKLLLPRGVLGVVYDLKHSSGASAGT